MYVSYRIYCTLLTFTHASCASSVYVAPNTFLNVQNNTSPTMPSTNTHQDPLDVCTIIAITAIDCAILRKLTFY